MNFCYFRLDLSEDLEEEEVEVVSQDESDIDRFANKSIKHSLVIVFLCYSKCTQLEGLVDLSGTSTHTQGASTITQGASTVTQSDCRDSQLMRAE